MSYFFVWLIVELVWVLRGLHAICFFSVLFSSSTTILTNFAFIFFLSLYHNNIYNYYLRDTLFSSPSNTRKESKFKCSCLFVSWGAGLGHALCGLRLLQISGSPGLQLPGGTTPAQLSWSGHDWAYHTKWILVLTRISEFVDSDQCVTSEAPRLWGFHTLRLSQGITMLVRWQPWRPVVPPHTGKSSWSADSDSPSRVTVRVPVCGLRVRVRVIVACQVSIIRAWGLTGI